MAVRQQSAQEGVPGSEALSNALAEVLRGSIGGVGEVAIVKRAPNIHSSTFASEIVTCRTGDGATLRLLCKYSGSHGNSGYGHRSGVAYEAAVYARLLCGAPGSLPRFYGSHRDAASGNVWLFLEYLPDCLAVSKADENAIYRAARWLGEFHAAGEAWPASEQARFLTRYDADYYHGWAQRTQAFADALHGRYPWVAQVCTGYGAAVDLLLQCPPTVIHGEFVPKNVLAQGELIYPIDWESAAIAAGEIDLASLVDNWEEDVVERCMREYRQARWGDGPAVDFERRFVIARLYVQLRWLGDPREWAASPEVAWRFAPLRDAAQRLGVL